MALLPFFGSDEDDDVDEEEGDDGGVERPALARSWSSSSCARAVIALVDNDVRRVEWRGDTVGVVVGEPRGAVVKAGSVGFEEESGFLFAISKETAKTKKKSVKW